MFTGIIEHVGVVSRMDIDASGGRITVHAPALAAKLAVSASIAVNGCCLTVVESDHEQFSADLSPETLGKTAFPFFKPGSRVNLEQPLTAGKELGGHLVLGHVDSTGRVAHLTRNGDSWNFGVQIPAELTAYVVSKGSITIDGVSLTIAAWRNPLAEIAVIPYTHQHTNISDRSPGDPVNLEADIFGKYVERFLDQRRTAPLPSRLRLEDLVGQGF